MDFVSASGCVQAPGQRYFVYSSQSSEQGWDLGAGGSQGPALPETETSQVFDTNGNLVSSIVSTIPAPGAQPFVTTTSNVFAPPDLANWIHGRLLRSTVTKTAP